ncbi:MAG: glycosyltransferase [Candidatus Bathyarchaeia archaeon]|jgi:glycogen synthase
MKKPNVLMTTMEYDVIKVGGLSAALTSMAHALKKYANPRIVLPKSGCSPPWKKVEEKQQPEMTMQVYEHNGVSVYTLSNQILDTQEVYPEPADQQGIKKIDEFSRRLTEVVDDIDFDVVHMQDFFAYKAMDKFKEMGKPILLTIHRLHREYPTWFSAERTALNKADYLTVVGESYYKEDEKELFHDYRKKTTHVFNGVDTEFWNVQACSFPKLARKQRRKTILQKYGLTDGVLYTYVGRFDPVQKGVDILLKASEEFLKTENVKMIVVGVGDKKLEKQSKELETRHPSKLKVFNQLLSKETVRDIYCSADFALVPSLFEPFGLVQLEAMSSECVPIGSKTGGIKDTVISYGENPKLATGFLVKKGSPPALLEGMRKAFQLYDEKPEMIERMRGNGRSRCETVFQWNVSARKYFDIYEKLLHQH